MEPRFFAAPKDFRRWLEEHHATERELLVGFWKTHTGKPSITWPQSVDQALCFGRIDGVRRSLGEEAYTIRFTPRKPGSVWSRVNLRRFGELKAQGLVQPAGQAAFDAGRERTDHYSYESEAREFAPAELAAFKANAAAWADFEARPPSYRKPALFWVTSAKKPETRARRLAALIEDSAAGRKIAPLDVRGRRP